MPSVLQELAGEDVSLDFTHVLQRVADWKARLDSLYNDVTSWFPELQHDRRDFVEMNEEIMREYGVAPVSLPILRFLDGKDELARFVPRGLWIIGANGRVDLFTKRKQYLIVDRSEYFSPALWEIAPALQRQQSKPFTKVVLQDTLG